MPMTVEAVLFSDAAGELARHELGAPDVVYDEDGLVDLISIANRQHDLRRMLQSLRDGDRIMIEERWTEGL
jgi:hypothetical protein